MIEMTRTVFRKGLNKALYKLFWIFFYTFALNDGTKMIQVTLKPVKMFKYKNTTVIILKYYRLKTFNFFYKVENLFILFEYFHMEYLFEECKNSR